MGGHSLDKPLDALEVFAGTQLQIQLAAHAQRRVGELHPMTTWAEMEPEQGGLAVILAIDADSRPRHRVEVQ